MKLNYWIIVLVAHNTCLRENFIPKLPYNGRGGGGDREQDKGLPCVISKYTTSIKEYNIESNQLIITTSAFNKHSVFWDSDLGNVGHINVTLRCGFSPQAVPPFFHFAFLCSPHSVKDFSANTCTFLPWPV